MLLDAKIDRKTYWKTKRLFEGIFDGFCFILEFILVTKSINNRCRHFIDFWRRLMDCNRAIQGGCSGASTQPPGIFVIFYWNRDPYHRFDRFLVTIFHDPPKYYFKRPWGTGPRHATSVKARWRIPALLFPILIFVMLFDILSCMKVLWPFVA